MAASKRSRIEYKSDFSSLEDSEFDENDEEITKGKQVLTTKMSITRNGKRTRCLSKNALMARENRLRKKMYIQDLESRVSKLKDSNKKLNSIIENQSFVISEIRKELKYLRSVVANSSDLRTLIKNIGNSTGMCVKTSLDSSLTETSDYVSKRKASTGDFSVWQQKEPRRDVLTPVSKALSSLSNLSELEFDTVEDNLVMDDVLFSNSSLDADPSTLVADNEIDSSLTNSQYGPINEHNYTNNVFGNSSVNDDEDVGVCLHLSKHRVSLEFCSTCSENALQVWK